MSYGDLSEDAVEKHHEAGEILVEVMEEARELVEPGVTHLEVAESAEERIVELGGEPAFPVNISIDHEASHATPEADDETVFGEDDMVCLDVGVHVDGYIADSAVTVDFSGNDELVEAAEQALDAALDEVEAGAEVGVVGEAIEDVIDGYGYSPVLNLSGHGLQHYDAHTGPSIPNRGVDRSVELEAGQVVAIEPFATDGSGKVGEGSHEQIFELQEERSVRDRAARQAMDQITAEFDGLPFAERWLDTPRPSMALRRLKADGAVKGYPVLQEDEGNLVSQAEHTLIVTEDGYELTTAGLFE
ncbi:MULTISPECIES: type II methionyl aminopeptidase [Halolamina]|uniref:Methionine aminopeptidase n=1 Tax=Halolamina pelagica TaxID=699431 RepID=A0A1I5SMQ4_9EURY|nr:MULTISPECIES: type II methionyl aminopeptidase [Halolamina]NHX36980.1 type II methionyl aminopeptidase [Halolamina sp. R1-12]SFP72030.1 methionyl aminopeptidase [Halolamina pelagica]